MTHHRPRRRLLTLLATLAALIVVFAVPVTPARGGAFSIALGNPIASGLHSPTQVTNAADGSGRLFVVERRGTVKAFQGSSQLPGYFLDIRSLVDDSAGERGLLGLAFHPSFETNRRVYVYFTRNGGDIVVARLRANTAGTAAPASSLQNILVIEHSARTNHNGGAMAFGPDGYLYIGTGDGGGGGDPDRNGQSKTKNLLAKILRIHVGGSGAGPYGRYSIPSTNPFRGSIVGRDEVWAWGLRNPWRISFDRTLGRLYIADVGQGRYEEINRETAGSAGGRNYGWSVMEGKHCFRPATGCSLSGDILPVAEYTHSGGNCSITGGYVYRGTDSPAMVGYYIFADFCSGRIWSMAAGGSSLVLRRTWAGANITSFGESDTGELYLVTMQGRLHKVTAN